MNELAHAETRLTQQVGESGPKVIAAPGYLIFVEAMWGGRVQTIPVDPAEVDEFIAALRKARKFGEAD